MDFSWSDVLNIFDIISRSQKHQPLTPSERAWLKAWRGVLHAVIVALVLFVYQFLTAHATLAGVNWEVELTAAGALLWRAYSDARAKFFTSQAPAEQLAGNILGSVAVGNGESAG